MVSISLLRFKTKVPLSGKFISPNYLGVKTWFILFYRLQVHVALETGGHFSDFLETAQRYKNFLEVRESNGEWVYLLCVR